MTIIFSAATYLVAIIIVAAADHSLLRRYIPSFGFISVLMYGVTYGLGLMLWRSDPSSLFGYGSLSTTGALDALLNFFSIGILSLSASYGTCRVFLTRFQKTLPQKSLTELSWPHRENLSNLSFLLITLSVLAISVMSFLGLFARSPAIQAQILQSSTIAKVIIGSSIISRLAPIGFFLIPFVWKQWSFSLRFLITTLLSVWQVIAISSGSRGLLISLPVYLMIGALCWQKIPLRLLLISLLASALLFLPLAEHLRVSREGDQSIPELKRAFQTFQIGKQLMGTSHEFYLALSPTNCSADLTKKLSEDSSAAIIYGKGVKSFPDNSLARWNVVGLYDNCLNRTLGHRNFDGFHKLPLGLLPSTFYKASPNLFDGQELSENLSSTLDLKPGEISYATISLFADSWWRWGRPGLVFGPASIGALLAVYQSFLSWMIGNKMVIGLLAQFLVVTLICTWINNTILTMTWYLFWDLPKSWLELILLSIVLTHLPLRRPSVGSS